MDRIGGRLIATAQTIAALAAAAGVAGAAELARAGIGVGRLSPRLVAMGGEFLATIRFVQRGGGVAPPPMRADRRRLNAVAAVAGAFSAFAVAGWPGLVVGGVCGPWLLKRGMRWRRGRVAAAIDQGVADLALMLAAALSSGVSVRGALLAAPERCEGPLARELDGVRGDLLVGASTGEALVALRRRASSPGVDAIVRAIELQRRSGGDLVSVLSGLAEGLRERARSRRNAQAATAQARATAMIVSLMAPAVGLVIELAQPGAVTGALTQPAALVTMILAVAGHALGWAMVWRLAAVAA